MSAVEKGPSHLNVAKAMMRRDPTLVSLKLESGMTVIHWALEKDQQCKFAILPTMWSLPNNNLPARFEIALLGSYTSD